MFIAVKQFIVDNSHNSIGTNRNREEFATIALINVDNNQTTFNVTARCNTQPAGENMSLNATFKRASIEAAMEFGSIDELAGYLAEKGVVLTKIFGDDMEIVVKGLGGADSTAISSGTVETGETATEPKKRGPKPRNAGADPATAVAPPPAPIPGAPAAPAAPSADLVAQNAAAGGGVPDYLKRVETPPAPPAPPAPPIPPAAPPSGILAGKVIGELERRGSDDTTKKALVEWLASPGYGLVMPTASFDETIAAVRLMQDDKLSAVAAALQIAA